MTRYVPKVVTLEEVARLAFGPSVDGPEPMVFWAMHTTWWTVRRDDLGRLPNGLPCDPRGSVLMQAAPEGFLAGAEENVEHYGKHGLAAFLASYHGNLVAPNGQPTSVRKWDEVNQILDQAIANAERVLESLRS